MYLNTLCFIQTHCTYKYFQFYVYLNTVFKYCMVYLNVIYVFVNIKWWKVNTLLPCYRFDGHTLADVPYTAQVWNLFQHT